MFCSKCGAPNDDNNYKCTHCQSLLLRHSAPTSSPPPAQQLAPQQSVVIHTSAQGEIQNYLTQSILCTVLCCFPFGIPALIYSAQVNQKLAAGDIAGAKQASDSAKLWCWLAFGFGIPVNILIFIIML